jgi:hypothetical protein
MLSTIEEHFAEVTDKRRARIYAVKNSRHYFFLALNYE